MDTQILNWLAGIFEGEGTITINVERDKHRRYGFRLSPRIMFTISLKDEHAIKLFEEHIPVKWYKNYKKGKDLARIVIKKREDIITFLNILSPFFRLPTTKRKVELMMKFFELVKRYKRLSKEELIQALLIVKELRELQKRTQNMKKTDIDALIKELTGSPECPASAGLGSARREVENGGRTNGPHFRHPDSLNLEAVAFSNAASISRPLRCA